jgi:hypothetical protein
LEKWGAERWGGREMAGWRNGGVEKWWGGGIGGWRNGGVEKWWGGGLGGWRYGGMEKWEACVWKRRVRNHRLQGEDGEEAALVDAIVEDVGGAVADVALLL